MKIAARFEGDATWDEASGLGSSIQALAPAREKAASATFELRAGPLASGELTVVSFRGTEGMSRLFSFDVIALSELDREVLEPLVLGLPATLLMHVAESAPRVVRGITTSLAFDGTRVADDLKEYRFRLAPRMWLLKRRKNSRIFQELSIVEIIDAVLAEHGVARRWAISRKCPRRSYCVQYQETDYEFVTRLLAEEGLSFHFEPPAGLLDALGVGAAVAGAVGQALGGEVGGAIAEATGLDETLVFADDAGAYPPIAHAGADEGSLLRAGFAAVGVELGVGGVVGAIASAPEVPFRDASGFTAEYEYVSRLSLRRKVREKSVTLRDYDFKRPNLNLTASSVRGLADFAEAAVTGGLSLAASALSRAARSTQAPARAALSFDVRAALGSIPSSTVLSAGQLEIYDHHGEFEENDVDYANAKVQLEQYRARARVAEGTSTCRRLTAGHRFRVVDIDDDLAQEYTAVRVTHRGVTPEAQSENRAVVYENSFECVPSHVPYRPRRPMRAPKQVMESAAVVGPAGEEIYTDAHGRIKVQFHWDREGGRNEYSSCWMRVVQSWAGTSWGSQFIPRIGMEVLVSFLGGDEDRPVVMGCVYNGSHPTPHLLPANKTRSGIRTQSTPGGQGFNEIMFEDQAGAEELYLRAQKDMRELVLNNHVVDIRVDDTTRVGRDQKLEVVGDQSTTVLGHRHERVEKDETIHVSGDRLDTVAGNVHETVHKDLTLHVGGNEWSVVSGNTREQVKGDATREVAGDAITMVVGKTPRASLLHVEGTSRFTSSQLTEITSEKEVVIRCGKSVLRIMPDAIELVAPEIRVRAPGSGIRFSENQMEIRAKKGAAIKGEEVTLQSSGAKVKLTDIASVEAAQINLATEAPELDVVKDRSEKTTQLELLDDGNNPIPNRHYVVVTKNGDRIGGMVGKDGKDDVHLQQGDEVVFHELSELELQ